jgi:hypothetical protein
MNIKSIPGWTIYFDEVSNGVLKVTLTNAQGLKTEITDKATDHTLERAIGVAFNIEKQISQNWNLFLYDLAVQNLSDKDIKFKEYNDKVFGSWFIERHDRRLVYDGKDSWLIFQTKTKDNWKNIEIIKSNELKYSSFVIQINKLIESTTHKT